MENLFMIAGLGNPGRRYENTRHNVGFDTVDVLSVKHNIKVTKVKHKALIGEGVIKGQRVLLVKPQTYMNLSGESLREIVEWYKGTPASTIIIYDDVDLPLGKVRIRAKGSAGTHNGMRSVIFQLQSDDFPRVRIGIDKAPEGWELSDYVLSKFNVEERKVIDESIIKSAEAVETIIAAGIEAAMCTYNKVL